MKTSQRLFTITFMLFVLLCIVRFSALAQKELEVPYPTIPYATPPRTINIPLSSFLRYIYNFGILTAGVLSFFLLAWGGILYLFSQGRPALLNEARKQITNALFGLLIILSSYLILNTINPQLTLFSEFRVNPFAPIPPEERPEFTFTAEFNELPLGTLITSEYSASVFLRTTTTNPDLELPTTTDPDTSREDYVYFFTATSSIGETLPLRFYPTDFQGGLHGRRLMRIHEVASTTLPAFEKLKELSEEFTELMEEFGNYNKELYEKVLECVCDLCQKPSCAGNGSCNCESCNTCIEPEPDVCPDRERMDELREDVLPSYYEEETDPINCEIYLMKYLAEHIRRFLDANIERPLVKNCSCKDYEDQSYWHSDEAEELREKIQACIDASNSWEDWIQAPPRGDDLQTLFDEIEGIIWKNPATSMASVENKGTWSAKTDPPQRDLETNIKHLEAIYGSVLEIKDRLNPYSDLFGSLDFLPWHGLIRFQVEAQMPEIKVNFGTLTRTITYPYSIPEIGEVRTSKDPANFYASAMRELYPTEPQGFYRFKNVAFAQEAEEEVTTKTSCARVVEIPIGNTTDEALRLMEDILRELKNIYEKGHKVIDDIIEQGEIATSTTEELVPEFIDLTSKEACECSENCEPSCNCECSEVCDDEGENCETHCTCECLCLGNACPLDEINQVYGEIQSNIQKIKDLYEEIKELIGEPDQVVDVDDNNISIYQSFFRLNSVYPDWHPNSGEKVSIGKKYCCSNPKGNCRNPPSSPSPGKGDLRVDELEEREYTLKEKLAEVQKLLNRSRGLVKKEPEVAREEPEAAKSVYRILLEELIELGYAEEGELTSISPVEKLDLSNCTLLLAEVTALVQLQEEEKLLLNSKVARGEITEDLPAIIDLFDYEKCSPDPMLDCDYFNPASERKRSPLSCYIYDGDIEIKGYPPEYRIPKYPSRYGQARNNLANNLFCCVITHE